MTVKRVDKNGTPVTAKYTPTVTPVTPTATPAESEAPQGVVQTGTVTFTEGDPVAPIDKDTITLLDENGQPAASVDANSPAGDVIGTFTVDKETGVVTFTPTDKSYSGDVVPVKVQAKDANGNCCRKQLTHLRLLQLFQQLKMLLQLINKVKPKQVNLSLQKVIQ